jgi:hypothetical protein
VRTYSAPVVLAVDGRGPWKESGIATVFLPDVAFLAGDRLVVDLDYIEDALPRDRAVEKSQNLRSVPLPEHVAWNDLVIEVGDTSLAVAAGGTRRELSFEESGFADMRQGDLAGDRALPNRTGLRQRLPNARLSYGRSTLSNGSASQTATACQIREALLCSRWSEVKAGWSAAPMICPCRALAGGYGNGQVWQANHSITTNRRRSGSPVSNARAGGVDLKIAAPPCSAAVKPGHEARHEAGEVRLKRSASAQCRREAARTRVGSRHSSVRCIR